MEEKKIYYHIFVKLPDLDVYPSGKSDFPVDENGFTDITSIIADKSLKIKKNLMKNFKFAQDSVNARTIYNKEINQRFFLSTDYIPAYVGISTEKESNVYGYINDLTPEDDIYGWEESSNYGFEGEAEFEMHRFFTGAIAPLTNEKLGGTGAEGVDFEIVDNNYLLEVDCPDLIYPKKFEEEWYLFNPKDLEHSVLWDLLQLSNYKESVIATDFPLKDVTIDVISLKEGQKISEIINEILYFHHCTYTFDGNGRIHLFDWGKNYFATEDIRQEDIQNKTGIQRSRKFIKEDGYKIEYSPIRRKSNALVYREDISLDDEEESRGKTLAPSGYLPADPIHEPTTENPDVYDIECYQKFSSDWLAKEAKIVSSYNHKIIVDKDKEIKFVDPTIITASKLTTVIEGWKESKDAFGKIIWINTITGEITDIKPQEGILPVDTPEPKFLNDKARLVLRNMSADYKKIREFDIRANVIFESGEATYTIPYNAQNTKKLSIKYISKTQKRIEIVNGEKVIKDYNGIEEFAQAYYNRSFVTGQYEYRLTSANKYSLGECYSLKSPIYTAKVLLTSMKFDHYTKLYTYEFIGLDDRAKFEKPSESEDNIGGAEIPQIPDVDIEDFYILPSQTTFPVSARGVVTKDTTLTFTVEKRPKELVGDVEWFVDDVSKQKSSNLTFNIFKNKGERFKDFKISAKIVGKDNLGERVVYITGVGDKIIMPQELTKGNTKGDWSYPDNLPTETDLGETLENGDFFVNFDGVAYCYNSTKPEGKEQWIKVTKEGDALDTNNYLQISIASANKILSGKTTIPLTDTTASTYGWFQRLVALEAIVQNLVAKNLSVTSGSGKNEFNFDVKTYKMVNGKPVTLDKPTWIVTYGGKTIFQIFPKNGNVFFGEPNEDGTAPNSGFMYNADNGSIEGANSSIVIQSDGTITTNSMNANNLTSYKATLTDTFVEGEIKTQGFESLKETIPTKSTKINFPSSAKAQIETVWANEYIIKGTAEISMDIDSEISRMTISRALINPSDDNCTIKFFTKTGQLKYTMKTSYKSLVGRQYSSDLNGRSFVLTVYEVGGNIVKLISPPVAGTHGTKKGQICRFGEYGSSGFAILAVNLRDL